MSPTKRSWRQYTGISQVAEEKEGNNG